MAGFVKRLQVADGCRYPGRAVFASELVALDVFADIVVVVGVAQADVRCLGDGRVVGVFVFVAVPEVVSGVVFAVKRVQPVVVVSQGGGGDTGFVAVPRLTVRRRWLSRTERMAAVSCQSRYL